VVADQVSGLLDRRGVAKAMDIIERNIQWGLGRLVNFRALASVLAGRRGHPPG
jgi:hypothetical protein